MGRLIFESSCLPHTVEASHCPFFVVTVTQESCEYQFLVFVQIQRGIEPESTALVVDADETTVF